MKSMNLRLNLMKWACVVLALAVVAFVILMILGVTALGVGSALMLG